MAVNSINQISKVAKVDDNVEIGLIMDVIPITPKTLKILLPTKLLTARSECFWIAAIKVVEILELIHQSQLL